MEGGKYTSYKNREVSQKEAINEKAPVLTGHGGFWDHDVLEVPEYQVNTMKYE